MGSLSVAAQVGDVAVEGLDGFGCLVGGFYRRAIVNGLAASGGVDEVDDVKAFGCCFIKPLHADGSAGFGGSHEGCGQVGGKTDGGCLSVGLQVVLLLCAMSAQPIDCFIAMLLQSKPE